MPNTYYNLAFLQVNDRISLSDLFIYLFIMYNPWIFRKAE